MFLIAVLCLCCSDKYKDRAPRTWSACQIWSGLIWIRVQDMFAHLSKVNKLCCVACPNLHRNSCGSLSESSWHTWWYISPSFMMCFSLSLPLSLSQEHLDDEVLLGMPLPFILMFTDCTSLEKYHNPKYVEKYQRFFTKLLPFETQWCRIQKHIGVQDILLNPICKIVFYLHFTLKKITENTTLF